MLPVTCLAFRGPGGPSGALQGHMQKPERCSRAPWRRRGPSGASGDLPLAQWVTVRARLPAWRLVSCRWLEGLGSVTLSVPSSSNIL